MGAKPRDPASQVVGHMEGDTAQHSFVVQKHAATRLHYDFRLELDGVMLSWAVPKGPSLDPADKRLAVQVEDHPVSYSSFEGTIPPHQYGAGTVIVWDRGTWQPIGDPHDGLRAGKLRFELHGEKLQGQWELIRTQGSGKPRPKPNWLLFKKRDGFARPHGDYDVVSALPDSVLARPRVALPATLSPQLATLASTVPSTGEWVYELKFDGYRLLSRIEHGQVKLFTRGAKDWTARLPVLAREVGRLGISTGWIDGEIVVLGDDGRPDFNALQNAFDEALTERVVYYVFDLPYFDGGDLRALPLLQRRQALKQIIDGHRGEHVRFSEAFEADPHNIIQAACKLNLEGVIAKRADAPYVTRRSPSWLKLRCKQRQEFVIVGFTDRGHDSNAGEIGSLVLAVHDAKGRLLSVGRVGTGWSLATARHLKKRLVALETARSPFVRDERGVKWVEPELVAEVSFAQWTPQGHVRHAVFQGLRSDKPAAAVEREVAIEPARAPAGTAAKAAAASTRVTHPQRVIDTASGITKLDLLRYYESVAERMLPHLKARPCALLRGPGGVEGDLFLQKHAGRLRLPDIKVLPATLSPGHEPLLEVATPAALAGAAQMNVIEFHTWNSTTRRIDRPDRVVFDLDPGEGVAWAQVQEAATLTRALLTELGLKSWLKTSGGKGLHLFVPLAMRHEEAAVKAFAQAAVQHLARVMPDRFVAKSGPSNRIGKVFVDHLRNGHGATTAAAFSARARPGLGVSMPVDWDELPALKSGAHFTVVNARDHLSFERQDPWADYWRTHQSLARAIKDLWISGVRD